MDRNTGIAVGLAALAVVYTWLGRYCYRYFATYFNMPRWVAFVLSLGGIATYVFYVMIDEFTHTSMRGENSRAWKNDPEQGVHIVPWSEVRYLSRLDWDWVDHDRLMCMVYNLRDNRKRLARRVIKLEQALDKAPASLRERVINEAEGLLQGKINADLIWTQTHMHAHHAQEGVAALTRLFGDTLGPLAPLECEEEWVGF